MPHWLPYLAPVAAQSIRSAVPSPQPAHDPAPPPEPIQAENLLAALSKGAELYRNPWTRLTWVENMQGARLFAAGQSYDCSSALAESLCQPEKPRISADTLDQDSLQTLTDLINNGHFSLTNKSDD